MQVFNCSLKKYLNVLLLKLGIYLSSQTNGLKCIEKNIFKIIFTTKMLSIYIWYHDNSNMKQGERVSYLWHYLHDFAIIYIYFEGSETWSNVFVINKYLLKIFRNKRNWNFWGPTFYEFIGKIASNAMK